MGDCLHCVHSVLPLVGGEIRCGSDAAHRELGEAKIAVYTAEAEHDCPFFEDDELPW